jgi:L-rhamnose mutarotase
MSIRKGFLMSVKPGCEVEYEQRHREIWKDLETVLKDHGVSNYSIFLRPENGELFAYAEIEDEARWNAIAQTDACQRWWKCMGDIMATDEAGAPRAISLREVFHLD